MIETLIDNSGDEKITVVAYKDKIHPLIGIYSKSIAEKILEKKEPKKPVPVKKIEQKEEFTLDITKEYDELDVSLNSLDSLIELG